MSAVTAPQQKFSVLSRYRRLTTMENSTRPHDSSKNSNLSVVEDEKEKVKDFVYKHFREATDGSLDDEESPIKDHVGSTKKDKQLVRAHCKIQQRAVFSGKILSFGCSVCKDNLTFSPNDLLKHFQAVHEGTLPTYPCDLCDFVTNEFQVLQRHRIEHRNTLVTCELCNDNVQYSLLLLTRHYMMCHSINGLFRCDWCEFTTIDAGTFVQHIHHHNESHWKCSKCGHISLNEEDHRSHMKAHSGTFPFTCQVCGYGSARSEHLKKHTAALHKEEPERRNAPKSIEDSGLPANLSTDSKLSKKSLESQETPRIPKLNSVQNQNGRIIKQELSLEESPHFMDMTISKNSSRSSHSTELSALATLQESDNSSSDSGSHSSANGLTVLMVKNKISLPPNCTTKVMGFKMVDGKKHLVLKVIPTTKQDLPTQNHPLADDAGPLVPNPVTAEGKVSAENGQFSDCKTSTSHYSASSPRNGSCVRVDHDDIMTVKVKTEEEETSVCSLNSTPHTGVGEQTNPFLNRSLTSPDTIYPGTNELYNVTNQSRSGETDPSSVTESCKSDAVRSKTSNSTTVCEENVTSLSSPLKVSHKIFNPKPVFRKTVENCGALDESSPDANDRLSDRNNTMDTDLSSHITLEKNPSTEIQNQNFQLNVKHLEPPSQPSSAGSRLRAFDKSSQNTPNQEVFTFHNYSKEMLSTSPSAKQNLDSDPHPLEHQENGCDSSKFSLTLAESPEHFTESSCGDVEVDECIASVDHLLTEENPDSVLQDFNIIKIEEDSIPISTKQPETKSSSVSVGSFVEEHSNAIITQQLNKERTGSSAASSDSLKQTKTTLRILQLPEGKQPILLRAAENRPTKPVQVKTTPGFKLITSSPNPQINVSYVKPGFNKSGNTTGVALTPNTKVISVPAASPRAAEKGTNLLSAVQPGVRTTSNHYLINSQGFTGPVILSSTLHSAAADKMAKTQQTCYLVQRSVPFVQNPSTPGFKLASTQLPGSSRPVLAMPVNSADKSSTPQTSRQAFLLRYISPPKSGLFLNNQEAKTGTVHSQSSEGSGNKVIFKIVTPTGSLLSSGASTTNNQPLFLATRPQTQCFLVSNKSNPSASSGAKNSVSLLNTPQKYAKKSDIVPSRVNGKLQPCEADRLLLAPRSIRPPSQRKRRRKALFDEIPPTAQKARRLSSKVQTEKEPDLWKPVAKEVERTLRLAPFSSVQQIKCPRRYQPVVVLNHPDADVPEVANIMKVVNRYRGAVTKVSLSQKTVQALSDLNDSSAGASSSNGDDLRPRPVQSSVQERFLLKLKLRKKSKKKYEVVKTLSACGSGSVVFDCWFCGRLFNNQEDWIGHGQRHLMEATRDWNQLF